MRITVVNQVVERGSKRRFILMFRQLNRSDDPLNRDRNLFRSTGASDDIRIFSAKPTAMMRTVRPPEAIPDQRFDAAEHFRNADRKKPPPDG
jgi:hypothetical protein